MFFTNFCSCFPLARNGSVIVFFKLFFVQWVSEVKIKNALVYGIKENKSELLQTFTIDVNSIEIIGNARFLKHRKMLFN